MKEKLAESLFERINTFTSFYQSTVMSVHRCQNVKGLSPLEFSLLNELHCIGKVKVSVLAAHLNLSMPNCSRYINWLIRDGFVNKTQDEIDKRVFFVKLSDNGKNIIDKTLEQTKVQAMKMIMQFSEDQISDVIKAMNTIENTINCPIESEDNSPFA